MKESLSKEARQQLKYIVSNRLSGCISAIGLDLGCWKRIELTIL